VRVGLLKRAVAVVVAALALDLTGTAGAVTFSRGPDGTVQAPTDSACPTLTNPPPYEVWFNLEDMADRGYVDPKNPRPWDFSTKIAQVVCGAAPGSRIEMGMYFVRAIGTMTATGWGERPESDPEVVYDALEWVKEHRDVSIGLVLDGGEITPEVAKEQVTERLAKVLDLSSCDNGCFNTNQPSVFPFAINHEKFLSISDTTWANPEAGPHPVVLSTSTNFARSQERTYHQEVTLVYDDVEMYRQFSLRYRGMTSCARSGCATATGFPSGLKLTKKRGIWVDPIYRHYTDAGRGTALSFAPQPQTAVDFYVRQFDDVDCAVDHKVRVAMFKLTDTKAEQMVKALVRLKERRCDVKVLLSFDGGRHSMSPLVAKLLRDAGLSTRCTRVAMHTKMILIGPDHGAGRVLSGTQNMSVSALRYNEEHVVTFDPRRASERYREPLKRLYQQYLNGWYEFSTSTRSCL